MIKINRASVFYTALILGISNILLQAVGFIYRMFLTEMVGAEGLGVYKLTIQIYSVLLTVCTAGVCLVATNKSASFYAKKDIAGLKKIIRCCILIFLCIFTIFSSIILIFPDFIAEYILGDINSKKALYVILVCILFTGIENIVKSSLIGIKKVKYTAFSEIIEQLLRVCIVLWLVYNFAGGDYKKTAFLIVLGMTISEIFSIIFLGSVYQKIYKTDKKCKEKLFFDVLKIALPVSSAAILNNIIASASTIILPSRLVLSGFTQTEALKELGIISGVAMPILLLPIAIISSYSLIVMPSISKNRSLGNYRDIERKINKSFEATGFIGIAGTIALSFLAIPIGEVFFRINFSKSYIIMLSIAVIFTYYQIITASILNGLGLEKKAITHSVIGEFVQLLITILLCSIPTINIFGYIIGMIASPLIVSFLNMTYIFANYNFKLVKFVIKPLLASLFLYFTIKTSYELATLILSSQIQSIGISILIGGFVYTLVLRAFGINFVKYIINLNVKENKINLNKDFIF